MVEYSTNYRHHNEIWHINVFKLKSVENNLSAPTAVLKLCFVRHFLDCAGGSLDMVSLGEIAFWSLEGGDTFSCPEGNGSPPA